MCSTPTRAPKLLIAVEWPSTGGCWNPPEKDTPCSKTKKKLQWDGRRSAIMIKSNFIPIRWVTHKLHNNTKTNNDSKNGQEIWINISPKRTYTLPIGTWKAVPHNELLEKCKSRLQWDVTSQQSEWNESESHSVMSSSLWLQGLYSPWNSLGQNTGVGSRSLLQGIFPTQGLTPGLPNCRQILYHLSHRGAPPFFFNNKRYNSQRR